MAHHRKFKKKEVQVKQTRKEFRKEQRKLKKIKRKEHSQRIKLKETTPEINRTNEKEKKTKQRSVKKKSFDIHEQKQRIDKEKLQFAKLEEEMKIQRNMQLKEANLQEDKNIKRLEKDLKFRKIKRNKIPKAFSADGLDYLLEMCDERKMKEAMIIDRNLNDSDSDFEKDFALVTNKKDDKNHKEKEKSMTEKLEEDDEEMDNEELTSDSEHDSDDASEHVVIGNSKKTKDIEEREGKNPDVAKRKVSFQIDQHEEESKRKKKKKPNTEILDLKDDEKEEGSSDDYSEEDDHIPPPSNDEEDIQENEKNGKGYWEDIYGRTRDKQGNVIESKYVPPHMRNNAPEEETKKREELKRLMRLMKGLLNRLAENNMHSIASQIEELYMKHSRNDMNETLTYLMSESLVSPVITPERLVMEHAMLIAILHANVGTEVGAHVLQSFVKKFDEHFRLKPEVENKELDNIILVLSHLYNFKVFHVLLLFDILDKLTERFEEKEVELILLILRNVGFGLRKDDPAALKIFILKIQKKAGEAGQLNSSRVKFMFDIILAVKNNNMTKIPNYDPSHCEHLKKIMKSFVRKGNYVTELKISLDDLLKAEERGRWWVIGSAWTGDVNKDNPSQTETEYLAGEYSEQLLELAKKQHMNTDVRRNIFCILMTAEDFLDAFEKLLRLGFKNQQEREIIHVIMNCCLKEKTFNPFYSHLTDKLCTYDRRFQIITQCALWDKFKDLDGVSSSQLSNLAKFLVQLFLQGGLPISVLKVIHFAEVDKVTVRFLRQVLLGLLLNQSDESVQTVFERVAKSKKLHLFRESIRLFIHHFLLRNADSLPEEDKHRLESQTQMVDTIFTAAETKVKF